MAEQGYVLHSELRGHDEDVRALSVGELGLATGSRDKTVKVWHEEGGKLTSDITLVGHSDFVTAVASVPAGALAQHPAATILTGSRDTSIIVWDISATAAAFTLTGHKYQVTSLAVGTQGEIISASLDGTIREHSGADFKDVAVLEGHTGPVQAVLVLPDGSLLSGSNDGTIKRWVDKKCQQTFTGHTDTVRGLALLPGLGIVSASHDFTLRVWDFEGRLVSELLGHTAIVYSAAASASGLIASASEDNTARVWRADGSCIQTIPHAKCVWDVAFLPNNDLVTACADYVARVWTTEQSRQAPAEVLEAYQAALTPPPAEQSSDAAASSSLPAGMKLEDEVALLQPGTKDGQIKIIREGGGGMAYSWNLGMGQWEKVGQVVGGPDSGDDTMGVSSSSIDGVAYDHVISVEVDDRPPLKLGVNRGDNPYDVADRFIEAHDLPTTYREQVVQFIIQNTGGSSASGLDAAMNVDPFTGGAAYVPGSASFGRPGQADETRVSNADPFTGSGAYVPGASTSSSAATHIPATTMLVFDNLPNASAVAAKIRDLSTRLAGTPDTLSMALTDEETAPGGALDRLLVSASAAPNSGLAEDSKILLEKLLRWPAAALFPVLDITRLLILHSPTAAVLASIAGDLQLSPLGTLGAALATALAEPQLPGNQQTSLRLLCNAFRSDSLRAWLVRHAGELLDAIAPALAAPQKAVRGAAAAFLLNLAVLSSSGNALGNDVQAQALSAAVTLLGAIPEDDVEAQFRAVVALGTFMQGGGAQEAKEIIQDLECLSLLVQLGHSSSEKVATAATQVSRLLES